MHPVYQRAAADVAPISARGSGRGGNDSPAVTRDVGWPAQRDHRCHPKGPAAGVARRALLDGDVPQFLDHSQLARSRPPDSAQTSRSRGVFFVVGPVRRSPEPPMQTATDFHVFDTTLRDGAQREGISYSVADKLAVARLMD